MQIEEYKNSPSSTAFERQEVKLVNSKEQNVENSNKPISLIKRLFKKMQ